MEELSPVDALVQLSFRVQGVLAEAGATHQLSLTQMRMLGVLRGRRPGMAELARYLGLDKSSATGLVDRAAKRGLVQRSAAKHDGRGVTVELTDAGRELAARVESVVADELAALTAGLSSLQQRRLTELASKVVAGASAEAARTSAGSPR